LILLSATYASNGEPVLDTNLSVFEDLVGKQWEGRFEDDAETVTLYMNWEPIISGAAVQMSGSSSSPDMKRCNIYYFDRAKNQICYLAMTSNGFVSTGNVQREDSVLFFVGQQIQPDGNVRDTESRWMFLSDGSVRVEGGHRILYREVE